MNKQLNYYEILGVPINATQEQIKARFIVLAKKYHPDVNKTPFCDVYFAKVSQAYNTLKDENQRAKYNLDHNLFIRQTKTYYADSDLMKSVNVFFK